MYLEEKECWDEQVYLGKNRKGFIYSLKIKHMVHGKPIPGEGVPFPCGRENLDSCKENVQSFSVHFCS